MAEYVITFDTKSKALTVKKNGTEIPNVVAAEIARSDYYGYGYGGDSEEEEDFRLALTQMRADKEEDEREMIRTVANEEGELVQVEIPKEENKHKEDLRATAQLRRISSKASADIAEFFKEGF